MKAVIFFIIGYAFLCIALTQCSADPHPNLYPNLSCYKEYDEHLGNQRIIEFTKVCDKSSKEPSHICQKVCLLEESGILYSEGKLEKASWKQHNPGYISNRFQRYFFGDTPEGKNRAMKLADEISDCIEYLIPASKSAASEWGKTMDIKKVDCVNKQWQTYFQCIDSIVVWDPRNKK